LPNRGQNPVGQLECNDQRLSREFAHFSPELSRHPLLPVGLMIMKDGERNGPLPTTRSDDDNDDNERRVDWLTQATSVTCPANGIRGIRY